MVRVRLRRSIGFSLVELMVVIAVLAVLVGLLLPSMGSARDSARTIECMSQLRTLGVFSAMYSDANGDAMPRSQHSAFPNRVAPWGYAFFEYVSGTKYAASDDAWNAVFNGVYRCPHDRRTERWSYGYNVYYELTAEETGGRTWTRLSQVPAPSASVLFGELLPVTSADHAMAHFWTQFGAPPEIDPVRHGVGTGVVHADGHATSRPFSYYFDRSSNRDLYNPATAR